MVYFITNREDTYKSLKEKSPYYPDIEILNFKEGLELFIAWIRDEKEIGFDTETNGLDAYTNDVHLWIFGSETTQFVFHCVDINEVIPYIGIKLIGHNIKFDIKFLYANTKLLYRNVYDTMIAEQRIYMKSGLLFSLDNLVLRYMKEIPSEMDKRIRMEFVGQPIETFRVEYKHILYAVGDVKYLFPIKRMQEELINKFKLNNLIYSVELPLISIIAKAELTGFRFNYPKWEAIANANIDKRYDAELKLDSIVLEFIDKLPKERRIMFNKKMFINRPKEVLSPDEIAKQIGQVDLFGEESNYTAFSKRTLKTPPKAKSYHFNYGSEAQIVELFAKLDEPLLTDSEDLIIPTFNRRGKIDKTSYSFKTGEDSLNKYLIILPNTRMKPFIDILLEHRGLSNKINTFGKNYFHKLNPVTGNLHTIFRQCEAATGRLQSGGGRSEPDKINAQNIPRDVQMRNCFLARDGYSIGTHDYSGAELIVASSFSNDKKLYEIGVKGDIHSHVAQACWRAIYNLRAVNSQKSLNNLVEVIGKDAYNFELFPETEKLVKEIEKYSNLAITYTVTKSINKDIRTDFKPMLFGVIYGMYAKKAGMTLNISEQEGQMVIDIVKKEFPDVFRMVEAAVKFALSNGYIILNKRTNSRAWFPNIIKVLRGEIHPSEAFKFTNKEQSEARNIPIQGTQADFMKEASVRLYNWITDNGYEDEITMLSWVHDEIVDEHPNYLNGKSDEWKAWILENEQGLRYTSIKGNTISGLSFPEVKQLIMEETANLYLRESITIKADYMVEPYWTKD